MYTYGDWRDALYKNIMDSAFDENRHRRDGKGRFASGGGRIAPMKPFSISKIASFLAGVDPHPIAVASIPKDIQSAIGDLSGIVLLSRYTADKQKKHPEITSESFRFLQDLLDSGERVYDKKHHVTVIFHRNQPYVAVLKATNNGRETYLQSFRRTDEKNISALRKRGAGGG